MRFIQQGERRKVYIEQEGDLYLLSPLPQAVGAYRPVQQFDTREELNAFLTSYNVEAVWVNGN